MARPGSPSLSMNPPKLQTNSSRQSVGSEELLQQVQLLDLILNLDQRLEWLCEVSSRSQYARSRYEPLSASGLFSEAKPSDGTRRRSDRLPSLKEEEGEQEEKEEGEAKERGMYDVLRGEALV